MESQRLPALIAKRDEIRDVIRLLEAKPPIRRGVAVKQLVERLRHKAEWFDKRIQMESKTRTGSAA